MVAGVAFGGVFLLFVLYAVAVYNSLVSLRNRLRNAFSQIDVQLKRRHDLIPASMEAYNSRGILSPCSTRAR